MSFLLLFGQTAPLLGNPTGGTVVAGSATIGPAGSTLTINQSTQNAIINWQQFSIASGETTKFMVPNSSSATLNRVFGGNPSLIYGSLQSNGMVYLVNPSGIVVGPSGRIDTSSFLASTLDVSNQQFLAGGDLSFAGSSSASINNEGTIRASSGDVYLIANQVTNNGLLSAPRGNVGLAAGSDVLFQQGGSQHLFVKATPAGTTRAVGVTNAGTISAAAAELKAAGGNAYALAINNTGEIAATGYKKINGQVYLVSDGGSITNSGKISARTASGNGGTIVVDGTASSSPGSGTVTNSGTLDASATVAGGSGGSVTLKNMGGTTIHSGKILATGGSGGAGGDAEVSGAQVGFTGSVDLTADDGQTGNLLLDPDTLEIVSSGGTGTIGSLPPTGDSSINASALVTALNGANITLQANDSISVNAAVNASANASAGNLTLTTPTLNLNAAIQLRSGTLSGTATTVNVGASGLVQNAVDASSTTTAATINLAAGTTYGSTSAILIGKSLNLNGNGATLNGQNNGGDVVDLANGATVALSNLTVENGTYGVYVDYSNPTGVTASLNGVTVTGNSGTGIYNYYTNTLSLTNCTISGNGSSNGSYTAGGIENLGTLNLDSATTVTGNTGYQAGGIYNNGTINGTVNSSQVHGNTATYPYVYDAGADFYNSGTGTFEYNPDSVGGTTVTVSAPIYSSGTGAVIKVAPSVTTVNVNAPVNSTGGATVNSSATTVNVAAGSGTDNGYLIQGGVTLAGNGATVNLNAGTTYDFDGSTSYLTIGQNVAVVGHGATLNGQNDVSDVVDLNNGATVTLSNLTVENGGYGVYVDYSNPTGVTASLNGVTVTGNTETGIFNYYTNTLNLTNCTISGNGNANNAYTAGGIENLGTLNLDSATTVTGNAGYAGGGIYNTGTIIGTVNSSQVHGNTAASPYVYNAGADFYNGGTGTFEYNPDTLGGATVTVNASIYSSGTGAVITVAPSVTTVNVNAPVNSTGGATVNSSATTINVAAGSGTDNGYLIQGGVDLAGTGATVNLHSGTTYDFDGSTSYLTIGQNVAVVGHGAILNGQNDVNDVVDLNNGATVTLNNLTLENGEYGVYVDYSNPTGVTASLNGVTVAGNSGSGIYNYYTNTLSLTNCTINGNGSSNGSYTAGGIENLGTLNLDSATTVTGNTGYQAGGIYNNGTINGTVNSSQVHGNTATYPYVYDAGADFYNSGTGTFEYNPDTVGGTTVTVNAPIYSSGTGAVITVAPSVTTVNVNAPVTSNGSATVTSSATTVNVAAGSGTDNGYLIQGGVTLAGNGATVNLHSGTTYDFDGSTSGLTIGRNVTVAGNGAILNGQNDVSDVVDQNNGATVALNNLTLENGTYGVYMEYSNPTGVTASLNGVTVTGNSGTGIYNYYDGTLSLTNCTISGNGGSNGYYTAGGIQNFGTLNLDSATTVTGNTGYQAGGIYNSGTINGTVSSSQVHGNTATYPYVYDAGADFYNSGTGTFEYNPDTVGGTTVTVSAPIYSSGTGAVITVAPSVTTVNVNAPVTSNGSATVNSSATTVNVAAGSGTNNGYLIQGGIALAGNGAMVNLNAGTTYGFNGSTSGLTIGKSLTLNGNGATLNGQNEVSEVVDLDGSATVALNNLTVELGTYGVYVDYSYPTGVTASLNGVTLTGNRTGIFNYYTGTLNLTNCTISGNGSAYTSNGYDPAGGIQNEGTMTVASSTISGNTGYDAGGIYNSGALTISDTILAGNTAGGVESDVYGALNDNGYNLYGQNGHSGGFTGNGSTDILLSGSIGTVLQTDVNGNPLLANNGGPTETLALVTGSPAIEAGGTAATNAVDQRGYARNTAQSIGAYEYGVHGGISPFDTISGLAFTDDGVTPTAAGTTIDLIFDDSLLGATTTSGSGGFSFSVTPAELTGGILLTDSVDNGSTYYQANSPLTTITGINIWGGTLRIVADAASNTALGRAAGGLSGLGVNYTVNAAALATNYNVNLNIQTPYTLDGNVTATDANLYTAPSAALTTSVGSVTLAGSTMALGGSITSSGAVNFDGTNTITDTGGVQVGSFILQSGNWVQNSATLPSFSVTSDFELKGSSSFLRVTGGNGTSGSPYQITDIYGLQGLASPGEELLTTNAELVNNIDATSTATWNPTGSTPADAGFVPIGSGYSGSAANFTGTFNGRGYTINGLTINTPNADYVALFGVVGTGAVIENVGVTNVNVSGNTFVGGLVAYSEGMVADSYATGAVSGDEYVGGLVGDNDNGGTVQASYATAAVNGSSNSYYVGGLVGYSNGSVADSYATGAVSGNEVVGGLVGYNTNLVELSYATGAVTVGSGEEVGGLVGLNSGTVEESYATGAVSGTSYVGGLVGYNDSGTVETSYTTGAVTGGGSYVGGLVGLNYGTVATSYWANNVGGNGSLSTIGYNGGTMDGYTSGETLGAMEQQSTFQPATGTASWDFTSSVWTTNGGTSTPLLMALSVNLSGTTPGLTDTVDLLNDGVVLYTATASGANYSFDVPDSVLSSGALLTDVTGTQSANTFYLLGSVPGTSITGVNLTGQTLNVTGTGQASNTLLGSAVGSLNATTYGLTYTLDSSHNLATNSGVGISLSAPYLLDGNVTATNASLNTNASAPLATGVSSVNLTANSIALGAALSSAGTVNFNTTGAITDTGALQVGSFILQNGSWSQNSATLPAFSVTNDFALQNSSTFLRVTGGNGASGSPYQIADIYGLQGLGSPSGSLLSANAELVNDIDASGTATWNSGAGFVPIGNNVTTYNGTFNGQNFTINALTIDTPSADYVGLFGENGSGSLLENVGLTNDQVGGSQHVGGLSGYNAGTVETSYATGAVTAGSNSSEVGGLVGTNYGTLETSYATGAVSGSSDGNTAGGLVGYNGSTGTVETSYATGAVSGNFNVGGLVGGNDGTVETSHATGVVSGNTNVGGLVGGNDVTVETSYATGAVSGTSGGDSVGGLVGYNSGILETSYATGAVSGFDQVGGLAGVNGNGGTVETSFATGAVTASSGSAGVGGLVGYNSVSTVKTSYATGAVTGGSGSIYVGGLVGFSNGTVETSYWAQDNGLNVGMSGVGYDAGNGAADNLGATPETLAAMEQQSTFTPAGASPANWDFTTAVWTTYGNTNTPQLVGLPETAPPVIGGSLDFLSGTAYLDSGVNIALSGTTIDLIYDGSQIGSTVTNGSGGFSFSVSSTDLTGGILLTDATDKGDTYYQITTPASTISGINIWGSTLRVLGDTASNTALGTAAGSLSGVGINYTVNAAALATNSGVNMAILSNYALDGNITAGGALSTSTNSTLSGSANVTVTGSSVAMAGTFNRSGSLTVTSTSGPIALDGVGSSSSPATASGITLSATGGGVVVDDSYLATSGHNFTASGTGYVSSVNANGDPDGIDIIGSTINAAGGNISLTGAGGYIFAGGVGPNGGLESGNGVFVQNDVNNTLIETSGTGNISIQGTYNHNVTTYGNAMGYTPGTNGVAILGDSDGFTTTTTISVAQGTLGITGTTSAGISGNGTSAQLASGFEGVDIGGALIEATGTGGAVAITGNTSGTKVLDNASDGSSEDEGIQISGNNFDITANTLISVGTNGTLTINGTGGTVDSTYATSFNETSDATGLNIENGTQITGGTGATLSLIGTGGSAITNDTGTAALDTSYSGRARGVEIGDGNNQGGIAQVTVGNLGSIGITGLGGSTNVSNDVTPGTNGNDPDVGGIHINHGALITATGSATITLEGTGGAVTAGSNLFGSSEGVSINCGEADENTVVSSGSGLITITGFGGAAPNQGIGVGINGSNGGTVEIESTSGNISITGTGGNGYAGSGSVVNSYIPSYGVAIVDAATLMTGGAATISLIGTGGSNSSGVAIAELTNDPTEDTNPVLPTITAGGAFTANALSGTGINLGGNITAASASFTTTALGNVSVVNPTTYGGGQLLVNAGLITLNSSLTATSGNIVLVDTNQFVNNAGTDALSASAGDWQVWSVNPAGSGQSTVDADDGLTPNFIQYGATHGTTTPAASGNGLLYSYEPSPLAVTLNGTFTKSYNGTTSLTIAANSYTASASGLVGGDSISVATASPLSGTLNSNDVDTATTVTVSPSQLAGTFNQGGIPVYGYTVATVSGAATVTPAALTITANNTSKTYGQTVTFAGTEFGSSGLQNGETIGSVTLTSAGAAATANAAGSPYAIVPSAATGGTFNPANYDITYDNGALTIGQATLTITAGSATKTYGSTTPTFDGQPFITSGLVNGDTVTGVTFGGSGLLATAGVNGGAAYVLTDSAATGTGLTNYTINYANGSLTVTPATLTASLTGTVSKVYDGTTTATLAGSNYILTGLLNGDMPGVSGTANYNTPDVGANETITVSGLSLTGASAGNYQLSAGPLAANIGTITPATLTYVATPVTIILGSALPQTYSGTVTGFVGSDTQSSATTGTLSFSCPATALTYVGSYAIDGSGLTPDNNYTLVQAAANATALTVAPVFVAPSTTTGGADGSGSNLVPSALTPQPTPPLTPPAGINSGLIPGTVPPPSPASFLGAGMALQTGQLDEGLADSSGNGGQVGAGDAAQLGNGGLNNVANPHAAGVLDQALGPAVHQNLTDALSAVGNWTDASVPGTDDSGSGTDTAASGSGGETILSGGDVAEVGDNGTKRIPLSQAPVQLQQALAGDVLKGLGAGH